MRDLQVRVLTFRPAPKLDRELGLLGWVAIVIDDAIKLDNIAVRRTRDGRLQCFYPERRDAAGHHHRDVWPLHGWTRRAIETAILRELAERVGRRQRVIAP